MKLTDIKNSWFIILILFTSTKVISQNISVDTLYPFKVINNEADKNKIVIFNSTSIPYYISDGIKTDELAFAISKQEPVRIEYNEDKKILSATRIMRSGEQLFLDKHDTLVYDRFSYQKEKSFKKNDQKFKKAILDASPKLKTEIPSDSIQLIFDSFLSLSCEKTNECQKDDPCITFDFKEDGCYARAHWMKKLMDEKYGYSCEKIFVYGRLKANNAGNCGSACIHWGYHVAPYIQIIDASGKKQGLVIDPSLFDHAVSIEDWISAQERSCCSGCTIGKHTEYEIKPGYQYFPNGTTDTDYVKTLKTLRRFCRQCH